MNVEQFDRDIALWAAMEIAKLPTRESRTWAREAMKAFRIVARRYQIPLRRPAPPVSILATEVQHLQRVVETYGARKAEIALTVWVGARLLPPEMESLTSPWNRAAMEQASVAQYDPPVQPVQPVQEVMHLCFPAVEDGCIFYLYVDSEKGCFKYSMANGDCTGSICTDIVDYQSDEWAVAVFRGMVAFYNYMKELPI